MKGTRPRPPWQNPTRWEGVTCPTCSAPPGSLCRGDDVDRFAHAERKRLAAENARTEGIRP